VGLDRGSTRPRPQEAPAHCVSFGVNALYEKGDRYGGPGRLCYGVQHRLVLSRQASTRGRDRHGGSRLAADRDSYLGRVTKPRIIEAVREAKGEQSASSYDHLEEGGHGEGAERLLDGPAGFPERCA